MLYFPKQCKIGKERTQHSGLSANKLVLPLCSAPICFWRQTNQKRHIPEQAKDLGKSCPTLNLVPWTLKTSFHAGLNFLYLLILISKRCIFSPFFWGLGVWESSGEDFICPAVWNQHALTIFAEIPHHLVFRAGDGAGIPMEITAPGRMWGALG